jgi:hypothetical protein
MTSRSRLTTAAVALTLAALAGSSAFAMEREQNVYLDIQKSQQAPTSLWDVIQGRQPAAREEVRNTVGPQIRTDAGSGSSLTPVPAFSTDPHMYDYLSGSAYRGGE